MFTADERMSASGQKWAKGLEPSAPEGVKVTEFEKQASGLEPSRYALSAALRNWALATDEKGNRNCDVFYIPEDLLLAWDIRTIWDGDEMDEKILAAVPFCDMLSTDFQRG